MSIFRQLIEDDFLLHLIQGLDEEDVWEIERPSCPVCCQSPAGIILEPCRHLICQDCNSLNVIDSCPICRLH